MNRNETNNRIDDVAGATHPLTFASVEQILRHRLDFEKLIMEVSTDFVRRPLAELDHVIDSALERIGVFSGVDRCYLFQFTRDGARISNTHEWCAPGVETMIDRLVDLPADEFPWIMGRLRMGETVHLPDTSDLPEEATAERVEFQLEGIRSLLNVPIVCGGSTIGFLGFDAVHAPKTWDDDSIALLRIAGEIFAGALARKHTERILCENENRYLNLLEALNDGVSVLSEGGAFVYVNRRFLEMTGYEKSDLLGRSAEEVVAEEHHALLRREMENRRRHEPGIYDLELIDRRGGRLPVQVSAAPLSDPEGRYAGSIAVHTDISPAKRAERSLREHTRSLEILSRVVIDANRAQDLDSLLDTVLRCALDLVGFEAGGVYLADDKGRVARLARHAGLSPEFVEEVRVRSLDQPPYSAVFGSGQPILTDAYEDFNPELAGRFGLATLAILPFRQKDRVIGSLNLVSPRRHQFTEHEIRTLLALGRQAAALIGNMRAEENLQESHRRNEALIAAIPDLIFVLDRNGNYLDFRARDERALAIPREKLIGSNIRDAGLPPDQLRSAIEAIDSAIRTGEPRCVEYDLDLPVGRRSFEARIAPLSGDRVISIARDITERSRALEDLRALDKMKDAFVSLVSHELRTPLSCILSSSELLLDGDDGPESREEFLQIIRSESRRLMRLIEDVLDLSRIEAGGMPWHDDLLRLDEVARRTMQVHEHLLREKSLRFRLETDAELPSVLADRDRIQQVFTNLVGNAIKFSEPNGEIRIDIRRFAGKRDGEAPEWLRVSVTDQGIGIDEEDFQIIFDKFRQVSRDKEHLRDRPKGTGLGLPICKEIVQHYGGEIWVESGGGAGSTFFFSLPAAASSSVGETALRGGAKGREER
ncbi:MAG: PAS domain S-box protein [Candidatus Eisenbacteria bacterium]|nr:PAS domain S-box protein [Candidatus Eisenbacteria bacterium]